MTLLERLAFLGATLAMLWLARQLLARGQRHKAAKGTEPVYGNAKLIVVTSSRCSACAAQKHAVDQLGRGWRGSSLEISFIDAEAEPENAAKLAVMTVPTTILVAPNGTVAHINNGYVSFSLLREQIRKLTANTSRPG